jgi:uncharacterized repeat protein (TIGR03803 family)
MRVLAVVSCLALGSCAHAIVSSPLPQAPSYAAAWRAPAGVSYKTVFHFDGKDGDYPSAGLTDYNGTLFGATASSTDGGYGAFFKIAAGGAEKTFSTSVDLVTAQFGPLAEVGGAFYGTTYQGGSGIGTIFRVTPSGVAKTVHTFAGGKDGYYPRAGLVAANGVLYGTTAAGGTGYCGSQQGCGTVFKVTTSGKETVLYSFKNISTGSVPEGGLVYVGGSLYGTAEQGGTGGYGIVFKISLSGTLKTI